MCTHLCVLLRLQSGGHKPLPSLSARQKKLRNGVQDAFWDLLPWIGPGSQEHLYNREGRIQDCCYKRRDLRNSRATKPRCPRCAARRDWLGGPVSCWMARARMVLGRPCAMSDGRRSSPSLRIRHKRVGTFQCTARIADSHCMGVALSHH